MELRMVCAPDAEVGRGAHKHRCECGTVWAHSDSDMADCSIADHKLGHTCPSCGREEYYKYHHGEPELSSEEKAELDREIDEIMWMLSLLMELEA